MNKDSGVQDYVGIRRSIGGYSLGELEAQILDVVWDLEPPITAAKVFKIMYPIRELSYSTIMLTMSKLARKGFLNQVRSGPKKTDAFHYSAAITRDELGLNLLEEIAQRIFHKSLLEVANGIPKK